MRLSETYRCREALSAPVTLFAVWPVSRASVEQKHTASGLEQLFEHQREQDHSRDFSRIWRSPWRGN